MNVNDDQRRHPSRRLVEPGPARPDSPPSHPRRRPPDPSAQLAWPTSALAFTLVDAPSTRQGRNTRPDGTSGTRPPAEAHSPRDLITSVADLRSHHRGRAGVSRERRRRSPSAADHHVLIAALVEQSADEVARGCDLDNVADHCGRQSKGRGGQQERRERLAGPKPVAGFLGRAVQDHSRPRPGRRRAPSSCPRAEAGRTPAPGRAVELAGRPSRGGTPSPLHSGRFVQRISSTRYAGSAVSDNPAATAAIANSGIWSRRTWWTRTPSESAARTRAARNSGGTGSAPNGRRSDRRRAIAACSARTSGSAGCRRCSRIRANRSSHGARSTSATQPAAAIATRAWWSAHPRLIRSMRPSGSTTVSRRSRSTRSSSDLASMRQRHGCVLNNDGARKESRAALARTASRVSSMGQVSASRQSINQGRRTRQTGDRAPTGRRSTSHVEGGACQLGPSADPVGRSTLASGPGKTSAS